MAIGATNHPALIGEYVALSVRAGVSQGLCPFHAEKTPSFKVFDDHYHCYGCGAHGNAADFLMSHLGMSFPDSIRLLAGRAGIPVVEATEFKGRRADSTEMRQLDVLRRVSALYQHFLFRSEGKQALQAVHDRGLDEDTIARFGIGYAPDSWNTLSGDKGFSHDDLVATGLASRRTGQKEGCYDVFRNRIVFPVLNSDGHVVGFGGRILDEQSPKYLNTKETAFYHKGSNLFGIHQARNAIRKAGFVVVCEGFYDVVTPAHLGFENIVSTCGTALTESQVSLLLSLTNKIVFCFDGDTAGTKATWRSAELMIEKVADHHEVRFCTLPTGHDPDSMVRHHGVSRLQTLIEGAPTLSQYLVDVLVRGASLPEKKAVALLKAKSLQRRISSPMLSSFFRQYVCERLGLTVDEYELLGPTETHIDPSFDRCPCCSSSVVVEKSLGRWRSRCSCGLMSKPCNTLDEVRGIWNRRGAPQNKELSAPNHKHDDAA